MNYCQFCSTGCKNKFCSLECSGRAYSARARELYQKNPKFCLQCQTPLSFEQRKQHKFCSRSCSGSHNSFGRQRSEESRLVTSASMLGLAKVLTKIDWVEVQSYYDEGHTTKDCETKFNFGTGIWLRARDRGDFVIRPSLIAILTEHSPTKRSTVKKFLIQHGLVEHKCANCGQEPEWNGKPLVLVLDHKNGVNDDNRRQNLRLLCPNCNSQTETFCRGGQARKKSIRAKDFVAALKDTESIKDALLALGMEPTGNSYSRITKLLA